MPELKIGDVLTYYSGGTYRVLELLFGAAGYEAGQQLVEMARYVQLYDGEMPAGTKYVRPVDEILHGTVAVEGVAQKIFEINATQ
ncbi:MAG TPA: hypothetical protein VLF69_04195 [Candidatus Saccharimonadales bacterium]|nr:hypothetical protein [Candidatus Saccharimonadales bacterium]